MSPKIKKKLKYNHANILSIKEPTASYNSSKAEYHCTLCSESKDLSRFKQGLICPLCIEKIKKML